MSTIIDITGRQIFDSRGNPTVEVDVVLDDGSFGRAAVPSGASTGAHEAVELRDGGKPFLGKGVTKAVEFVNGEIFDEVQGMDALDQIGVDRAMIELDGTPNKGRLGANAILGVSLAVAKAAAESSELPLYRYVGGPNAHVLPVPMMNIINGGAHADNPIDMQEFMILPVGAESMAHAVQIGSEIFHTLKKGLAGRRPQHQRRRRGRLRAEPQIGRGGARLHRQVDREGRLQAGRGRLPRRSTAPRPSTSRAASTTWTARARRCRRDDNAKFLAGLVDKFPIISIEDGMAEDDWDGWKALTDALGRQVQLVGDDLFVTNTERLRDGIEHGRRQLDPGQGQPDRHADRDARRRRDGAPRRLHRGDVAPLRRDRGLDHRRPRGRHQLRPDQDRLARPAPTASPSTTSSSASRRSSAPAPNTRAAAS